MTASTGPAGFNADRYLCSAVHLSDGFAGYVLNQLTDQSLRALGPSPGTDLVALARHAGLAVARRRRRQLHLSGILAGFLLLALPLLALAAGEFILPMLILLLSAGWVCGFGASLVHRLDRYRTALAVRDEPIGPRDLAPALDAATEAYLTSVMASNVVVFSGGEPFVGSGQLLARWKLNVNCSRPANPSRRVSAFTAADLLKELTLAARRTGIPGLDVHNRLFVAGTAVNAVPGLQPDAQRRPGTAVGPAVLRAGIVQPLPTTRTYLCLRKVSWGGDLIVEVFVRVERTAAYLFVEHHAFVLLPLRAELCAAAALPRDVRWRAVLHSFTGTLGELLSSPGRMLTDIRRTARRNRAISQQRRQARRSSIYDYGAQSGLRQDAASPERIGLFQYADEDRDLGILRQSMLESIFDFLSAHGIDTSEFTRQQTSIVNQSISIGSIANGTTVIGPNPTVTQQAPAVPAQPAAAPWASTSVP
jgi:hypothetical protein